MDKEGKVERKALFSGDEDLIVLFSTLSRVCVSCVLFRNNFYYARCELCRSAGFLCRRSHV